jgi:outer membrane protein assembly factor BamB
VRRSTALAILVGAASPCLAAAADWPTYHGGTALDGVSAGRLPERPAQLWRVEAGAPVRATPVSGGGRIYALSERGDLLAVSPAGAVLWRARLGESPADSAGGGDGFAAPPLYVAGTVVAGALSGAVHAIDAATGRRRWRAQVGGGVRGSPTFVPPAKGAPTEVLVLSQADGRIARLDLASGRELGASPSTNRCDGSTAVAGGTLVYGNCDAALHFFSAKSLQPLGRLDLGPDGQVSAGVAIGGGVVYAGDRRGRLSAVDLATRRLLWVNRDAGGAIGATPAVHGDLVVFSSDDGGVYGLDARSGRLRWRHEAGGRPGAPLLDAGGRVAVAARGTLFILDARGGSPLWSREVSDEISDPALAEGRLLVGTDDGALVAFGESRGGAP